jgi:hypothetical protein
MEIVQLVANKESADFGAFAEPSDGLEPSTPPYQNVRRGLVVQIDECEAAPICEPYALRDVGELLLAPSRRLDQPD